MTIDVQELLRQAASRRINIPFGVSFDSLPEDYPKNVSKENIKTPIALLLTWAIDRKLMRHDLDEIKEKISNFNNLITSRNQSPLAFLKDLGDRFMPNYLIPNASFFLLKYYWPGWIYRYGEDFDRVFVSEYKDSLLVKPGYLTTWHVPPTWSEYDKISPIIDRRFSEWKEQQKFGNK
jgi:hypothetical protein